MKKITEDNQTYICVAGSVSFLSLFVCLSDCLAICMFLSPWQIQFYSVSAYLHAQSLPPPTSFSLNMILPQILYLIASTSWLLPRYASTSNPEPQESTLFLEFSVSGILLYSIPCLPPLAFFTSLQVSDSLSLGPGHMVMHLIR